MRRDQSVQIIWKLDEDASARRERRSWFALERASDRWTRRMEIASTRAKTERTKEGPKIWPSRRIGSVGWGQGDRRSRKRKTWPRMMGRALKCSVSLIQQYGARTNAVRAFAV